MPKFNIMKKIIFIPLLLLSSLFSFSNTIEIRNESISYSYDEFIALNGDDVHIYSSDIVINVENGMDGDFTKFQSIKLFSNSTLIINNYSSNDLYFNTIRSNYGEINIELNNTILNANIFYLNGDHNNNNLDRTSIATINGDCNIIQILVEDRSQLNIYGNLNMIETNSFTPKFKIENDGQFALDENLNVVGNIILEKDHNTYGSFCINGQIIFNNGYGEVSETSGDEILLYLLNENDDDNDGEIYIDYAFNTSTIKYNSNNGVVYVTIDPNLLVSSYDSNSNPIAYWIDISLRREYLKSLFNITFNMANCDEILPVELTYFNGSIINDKVKLEWETASEINSSHFEVEKSIDNVNWSTVGTVESAGNSNVSIQYNFEDNVGNGIYYYRLKQIDLDGAYELFGPITINSDGDGESNIVLYPNPVSSGNDLYAVLSSIHTDVEVKVMNVSGLLVYSDNIIMDSPNKLFKISDLNLNKGLYFIIFKYGSKESRKKVLIY